jgi:hypothetical protein
VSLERHAGAGKAFGLAVELAIATPIAAGREWRDTFAQPPNANLDHELFELALAQFIEALITAHPITLFQIDLRDQQSDAISSFGSAHAKDENHSK